MKTALIAAAIAFAAPCAQAAPSSAADGMLDLTFAVGGDRVVEFNRGVNDTDLGRAVRVDAQDRIYVVGDVNSPGGNRIGIVRLLPDGDIDESYGSDGDGRVVAPAAGNSIRVGGAAFDAQGYLLVAGSRVVAGSDTQFLVCRFSPSGALASFVGAASSCAGVNFNFGGDLADHAAAIVVQPDGRIVLGGSAASAAGADLALARLLPNGTLDVSFGEAGRTRFVGEGYVAFEGASLHRSSDGSLLAAGTAVTAGDASFGFVVRLDPDGVVDMSFGNNDGFTRSPSANMYYSDAIHDERIDRIIAIGTGSIASPVQKGFAACYLPHGGLVACPGPGGLATHDIALGSGVALRDLLRQPDGRWLVAGAWKPLQDGPWRTLLLRLGQGLALDVGDFGAPQGYMGHSHGHEYDVATSVAVQRKRIVVAGATKRANGLDHDYAVSGYSIDRIFASGTDD